ncbi:hypothetical protein [Ferruginivarius sediminum]|uniref:Uncharacterized protein n=1 Tax=Ferruginivarius sediminum TaxID=2661937 RepID=A0A369T816_9PROT|nr:hypothetical protein [Ferruginivarius sediminum]RDD61450.1 hypothetical protein DRB17_13325 [Ferruginivarius sediminum]
MPEFDHRQWNDLLYCLQDAAHAADMLRDGLIEFDRSGLPEADKAEMDRLAYLARQLERHIQEADRFAENPQTKAA